MRISTRESLCMMEMFSNSVVANRTRTLSSHLQHIHLCVRLWSTVVLARRGRETETETERDKDRERQRQTEIETKRNRQKHTHRHRNRQKQKTISR